MTDGYQNVLMLERGPVERLLKIRTYPSSVLSGCLEERVGGSHTNLASDIPIRDKLSWKGNKTVINWVSYPVGKKLYPWLVAPEVMYSTDFVKLHVLLKKRSHMWDYPEYLWLYMNYF